MRSTWQETVGAKQEERSVVSPLSLIATAFAPVEDVRLTLTPQLQNPHGVATELMLIDLGRQQHRLGGSVFAQAYNSVGEQAPDVDAETLVKFFRAITELKKQKRILAYHDRSDGGLFVTVAEMAFAARLGVSLELDAVAFDGSLSDVDGGEKKAGLLAGRFNDKALGALFAEELGAVIQVRHADRDAVLAVLNANGLGGCAHFIGQINDRRELRIWRNAKLLFSASVQALQQAWSEVSHGIARLRDDVACADEEFATLADERDPGLSVSLNFNAAEDIAAPYVSTGRRSKVVILREQGVNSQNEMASAFDAAGFDAYDVHMSDLMAGRITLDGFQGLAACGGFSYGDVLGAGQGWAKSILFHARLRDQFAAFFDRTDTFALGACNGCQMMSNLAEIIPGAQAWPRFYRNRSEQFEARLSMVEVLETPSIFLQGMAGSRMPIVVSHGEGRAVFHGENEKKALVALRYIDNHGQVASAYPANPNGSPAGITGLTTADGRFTIMMPHPERSRRTVQLSWAPPELAEDSPWMRMFRNARKWVG